MSKGYAPSVFVSSTCYDLNQVRADLKRFIEGLGFDAILSETPAFPVSPHISPVENCLQAIKERTDIFVLIVGARYGSQNQSGKSVTNLEYLEAKAKGLPIYIFVSKPVLNALPIWKQNRQGNYEGIVDSTKLFEFVETLRSSEDHWVFEFEDVIHITETLRRQFSYLFTDALALREKIKDLKLPTTFANLSGKPLKLLMEKPIGWEYSFFSLILAEEMRRDSELKWELAYGLKLGKIQPFDDLFRMLDWIQQKITDALALSHSAEQLLNSAIQDAFGPPGVPANQEQIMYVARNVARVRKLLLEWSIDFNRTEVKPEFVRLFTLMSQSVSDFVAGIEAIPARIDQEVEKGIEVRKRGEKFSSEIVVTITMMNAEELHSEIRRVSSLVRG